MRRPRLRGPSWRKLCNCGDDNSRDEYVEIIGDIHRWNKCEKCKGLKRKIIEGDDEI